MKENNINNLVKMIKEGKLNNSILKIKINKNGHIEYVTQTRKIKL